MPAVRALMAALALAGLTCAQDHVSFQTLDGWTIHADLYGTGHRGVVLAHGGRFEKGSCEKQAHALVNAGFRTLAIDLRGFGQSKEGPQSARSGFGSPLDVLAAVRYLHQIGANTVAVVGASMGGDAAEGALAEARPGEIDRVGTGARSVRPARKTDRSQAVHRKPLAAQRPQTISTFYIMNVYEAAPDPIG
jgi:pimeloyl-ACP methyl ester carboxylesterase